MLREPDCEPNSCEPAADEEISRLENGTYKRRNSSNIAGRMVATARRVVNVISVPQRVLK